MDNLGSKLSSDLDDVTDKLISIKVSEDDAEIKTNKNDANENIIIKDTNTPNDEEKNSRNLDDTSPPDSENYIATTVDQALLKTSPKLDKILTVQLGDRCDSPEFFSEYSKRNESLKPFQLTDASNSIQEPPKIQKQDSDSNFLKTYKIPKKKVAATEMDVGEAYSGTLDSDNERTPGASPTSFLDYDDDNDDNDDDDDDLLDTVPAFLQRVQEINERPFPGTPEKDVNVSSQGSYSSINETSLEQRSPLQVKKKVNSKSKFTLDGLLAEYEGKAEHEKEMNEIRTELKADLKEGGFVNILTREEELEEDCGLDADKQQILQQLHVQQTQLSDDRPGVSLFRSGHYTCLYDDHVHPKHCGFTTDRGSTTLEKHIAGITHDQYPVLLSSGIIELCFNKITCQHALLRWLFYLMSVHKDRVVCQACQTILLKVMQKQQVKGQGHWSPRVTEVISVLVNYGADLDTLVPSDLGADLGPVEDIRQNLQHQPGHVPPPSSYTDSNGHSPIMDTGNNDGSHPPEPTNNDSSLKSNNTNTNCSPILDNTGYNKQNLSLVLQVLAKSMYRNESKHTSSELTLLLVVIIKASLDTGIKHLYGVDLFQDCIAMIMNQYTDTVWVEQRLHLCRVVEWQCEHHKDGAHVAQLLSSGARGTWLQRRVAYLLLHRHVMHVHREVTDEEFNTIKIKDLYEIVPVMKELLMTDTYLLSSVITYLGLCVGVCYHLKAAEREELKVLIQLIQKINVKDNVGMLDRTRVKGMMVQLTSYWSLEIQTMRGKQTKIFEYTVHNSPSRVMIETLKTSQNIHDMYDSSDDNMSEDEDGTPRKLPKLSPP